MAAWIEIADYRFPGGWNSAAGSAADARAREACQQLEAGGILYFSAPPFEFTDADREFLVAQRRADSSVHKNVSYRPSEDALRGFEGSSEVTAASAAGLAELFAACCSVCPRISDALRWRATRSITPAFVRSKKMAAHSRCTSATTCFTWTPSPAAPRTAAASCVYLRTSIPREPRVWNVGENFSGPGRTNWRGCGARIVRRAGGTSTLWAGLFRRSAGQSPIALLTTASCCISTIT